MFSTYEEIEAEWERLASQSDRPYQPEAEATMCAYMQYRAGLEIRARCIHCGELLTVTERNSRSWYVTCPCGRSAEVKDQTAVPGSLESAFLASGRCLLRL